MSLPPPVKHIGGSTNLKVLAYGASGTGKTTFAGTSVGLGKTLILDAEGGLSSIPPNDNLFIYDIRYGHLVQNNINDPVKYATSILWHCVQNYQNKDDWAYGLKTIVLDSGTELANSALTAEVAKQASINSKRQNLDEVWLEDYGRTTNALTRFFRFLNDVPFNVVVTSLAKFMFANGSSSSADQNVLTPISVTPYFTQKLGATMMAYFDNVWYTAIKPQSGEYSMITRASDVVRAKTRGHKFPSALGSVVVNPNFSNIYNLFVSTNLKEQ